MSLYLPSNRLELLYENIAFFQALIYIYSEEVFALFERLLCFLYL